MAGGRPSSYDPAFCERVIELGKLGKLPAQMAAEIGVAKSTIHEWANVHKEFSDAFNIARSFCEDWWLTKSTETAMGDRNGNAALTKFMLSAAFGYRETASLEHSGANGGPIETTSTKITIVRPEAKPPE